MAGDSWRVRHRCVEKVDSSCRDPLLIPGQTSFRRVQNLSSAGASQCEGHSEKSLRDGPRGALPSKELQLEILLLGEYNLLLISGELDCARCKLDDEAPYVS